MTELQENAAPKQSLQCRVMRLKHNVWWIGMKAFILLFQTAYKQNVYRCQGENRVWYSFRPLNMFHKAVKYCCW